MGGEWTPPITLRYHVGRDSVVAQVEDQGPGFAPGLVPDPAACRTAATGWVGAML